MDRQHPGRSSFPEQRSREVKDPAHTLTQVGLRITAAILNAMPDPALWIPKTRFLYEGLRAWVLWLNLGISRLTLPSLRLNSLS
jgi:hypothetical protein